MPSNYDYQYGIYQLQQLLGVIPGLAGIFHNYTANGDVKTDGSANFISFLIQGDNPTYGDGTSLIADLYLDFGVIGVLVSMFIFGRFIRAHEHKMFIGEYIPSLAWLAILYFFSKSLYLSRSTLMLEVSDIVLAFLIVKLNFSVNKLIAQHQKGQK